MFAARCVRQVAKPLLRQSLASLPRATRAAPVSNYTLSIHELSTSVSVAAAASVLYLFGADVVSSEEGLTSLSKKEFREFAVLETEMVRVRVSAVLCLRLLCRYFLFFFFFFFKNLLGLTATFVLLYLFSSITLRAASERGYLPVPALRAPTSTFSTPI